MSPGRVCENGDSKRCVTPVPLIPSPSFIYHYLHRTDAIKSHQAQKEEEKKRESDKTQINASLPSTSSTSPTHNPVILIDVREPVELTGTGIIPTAISIPLASQPDALYLTEDEFETRFGFPKPHVDGAGKMVFYCKAGVRARAAAQLAVQAGYDPESVGVYEGSWIDWEKNGGRVERWEGDD